MSVNSLVLCNVGYDTIKAYPEFVIKVREGCHHNHTMTTSEGVVIHFDVDAFLDLGINFNAYTRERLLEALSCPPSNINKVSRRAIEILEANDPCKLERWRSKEDFDPNYITYDAANHIVYAKGTDIEIVMNSCIQITSTMWICMSNNDKVFAESHPNFDEVTSEWSALFRSSVLC